VVRFLRITTATAAATAAMSAIRSEARDSQITHSRLEVEAREANHDIYIDFVLHIY